MVQKSSMLFPSIWWAHPWPIEDRDGDGIFLEAHTRDAHCTWFMPLERDDGKTLLPSRELLLHVETKLLDEESIFP